MPCPFGSNAVTAVASSVTALSSVLRRRSTQTASEIPERRDDRALEQHRTGDRCRGQQRAAEQRPRDQAGRAEAEREAEQESRRRNCPERAARAMLAVRHCVMPWPDAERHARRGRVAVRVAMSQLAVSRVAMAEMSGVTMTACDVRASRPSGRDSRDHSTPWRRGPWRPATNSRCRGPSEGKSLEIGQRRTTQRVPCHSSYTINDSLHGVRYAGTPAVARSVVSAFRLGRNARLKRMNTPAAPAAGTSQIACQS